MTSGFSPEAHELLQKEEVQQQIFEIRNSDDKPSWGDIASKLAKEHNVEVSGNAVSNIYKKVAAMAITIEKKGSKHFNHLLDTLKDRFEKMIKRTEILSMAFDSLLSEIDEDEGLDSIQKASAKLKLIDSLDKLNKIFTNQLQIVMEEIDKIKIEQKKMIYDDSTIIQKINDKMPLILQQYEESGKIAILDKSLI